MQQMQRLFPPTPHTHHILTGSVILYLANSLQNGIQHQHKMHITTFSIENWKGLSQETKAKHTLSSCAACFHDYSSLQDAYPGKPIYTPESLPAATIVSLPPIVEEKDLAKAVLSELNPMWDNLFSHTLTDSIPNNLPSCNSVRKKPRMELKRQERACKRKIASHINHQLSKNATMSVLAEADSMASYGRKRLALSYEKSSKPQKPKSHSPN